MIVLYRSRSIPALSSPTCPRRMGVITSEERMTTTAAPSRAAVLGADAHRRFHHDGFTAVAELVPRAVATACREAAVALGARRDGAPTLRDDAIFHQLINVWRVDETLRALTLHPRLLAAVDQLAGRPMRLWHDQLFIKPTAGSRATEFHQDLPYWPLPPETFTVSAWIALGDIAEEDGCLTFLPGTQELRGAASDLERRDSLIEMYPGLAFAERVAIPLRAGGCTFHQGYTAHRAGANRGAVERIALSVIFIDADARCDGKGHALSSEYGLTAGGAFPDAFCPPIRSA
jgi:phytanoyl-CoA hydroxylase